MSYIVRSVVPFIGQSEDKETGKKFSWNKMKVYCEEIRENDSNYYPPVFGHPIDVCLSLRNDFSKVVITNGLPVSSWNDLDGCKVNVFYDQWKKPTCISVLSIDE